MKGYHEKQPVLLRKILEKLTDFKVDSKRFEIYKEMVNHHNPFYYCYSLSNYIKLNVVSKDEYVVFFERVVNNVIFTNSTSEDCVISLLRSLTNILSTTRIT